MELPDAAIRWLVQSAANNWELACLSNVCRKWRTVAVAVVLEQGHDALNNDDHGGSNLLLLASMVRFLLCRQRSTDYNIESFCIAWFHPLGMEIKQLSIDGNHDSDVDEEEAAAMRARDHREISPEPFAPSGGPSYAGSEEEAKGKRRAIGRSRSPTPLLAAVGAGLRDLETQRNYANCMYQWNGYQDANEILKPFGYCSNFVNVSTNHMYLISFTLDPFEYRVKQILKHFTITCRESLIKPRKMLLGWRWMTKLYQGAVNLGKAHSRSNLRSL